MLHIDGSQGEGGGQVLRTSLSMAALTGRSFRIHNIRANRSKPGLRPQHLTAVRAVAAICAAQVEGAHLDSTTMRFQPQSRPQGGSYRIDVSDAAQGGSAGAVMLVLQALLWPLLFAAEASQLTLIGGTFVPYSPAFHYMAEVARPAFARFGATFDLDLQAWGWYPAGGGKVLATIQPVRRLQAVTFEPRPVRRVEGVATVTNLPAHIPDRMARRAENVLREMGLNPAVTAIREKGAGPGAGIILWMPQAGFSSVGRLGLPADKVADAAVAELQAFVDNGAAVDPHLADQLLIPMALAGGESSFTTHNLTLHTLTNAMLLQQWLDINVVIEGSLGAPGRLTLQGTGFTA